MTRLRAAAASALLAALLLLAAACAGTRSGTEGAAAAAGRPPSSAEVRLVVTRDWGRTAMRDVTVPLDDRMTVMRLLAENAEVDTGYGGRFVNGVDGVRSTFDGAGSGSAADWFYWVDGALADVGADDWKLAGGETVWWDYHQWQDAMYVPLTLSAFPRPFAGEPLPVAGHVARADYADWATSSGLRLGPAIPIDEPPRGRALVVATVNEALAPQWLADILEGRSETAGVFVRSRLGSIEAFAPGLDFGLPIHAAIFVVPNPRDAAQPLLLVLGDDRQAVTDLLARATPEALSGHVGLAVTDEGRTVALPLAPSDSPEGV
jgi:hypothetical protein